MPLNTNDQLNIVKDILQNQQIDCCGSVSECQQIQRITKSLLAGSVTDQNAKNTLTEVYQYSQEGQYTQNLDHHILNNKQNISNWIQDLT